MEPSVDLYQPSRMYARAGWAALAGSLVCVLCGLRAPLAFIPASLCFLTGIGLAWLATRPPIRVSASQFNIGQRAIAWREVREINNRFTSPLILNVKLTNARRKLLVFAGEPERIARLMYQLRRRSYLASFDGVAYRDYWLWSSVTDSDNEENGLGTPVRMVSAEDEQEIERIFQKLKSVGRSDSRKDDATSSRD
jgi:hypothetical protein